MKVGKLNHVGIAVPSLEEAMETYRTLYGATDFVEPFDMPAQGVKVAFVNLPNSQIELIEPLGEDSPILNYLAKNPKGGQHHVCFEVDDVNQAIEDAIASGASIIGKPRIGAHGTLMIFVHPKNSNGVLVELMEPPKDH
ncbi:MAG: methylmalonyl-CoA epimerase [Hirschia sp.]|nr:methylmalonyl-CoA epimerase [Hirschia sp.]MBF18041.1 methylmalonyl-CoA epimerase [Hirschia sp.]